jgi:hypothetical protein
MSITRGAAGATATTIAVLALAAGASARPDYQVPPTPPAPAATEAAPTAQASPIVIRRSGDGGLDTLAVLAVAGGTLLVGAAGGFGGARVTARRHAVQS